MSYKYISVPDEKNSSGQWLKSTTVLKGSVYGTTRAYTLRKSIKARLSPGYEFSENYKGVTNEFESFQCFAEWCQSQHGYMNSENGRFWALDKDLKGVGLYTPDSCIFVPNSINSSILGSKAIRGDLPMGVTYRARNHDMVNELANCYAASVKVDGKRVHLGYYSNPLNAHKAWQLGKIDTLVNYKSRVDIVDHLELQSALLKIIDKLQSDVNCGLETVRLTGERNGAQ